MSGVRRALKDLITLAARFLDADNDGKLEIADLAATIAKASAMQKTGMALIGAATSVVQSLRSAAAAGQLEANGQPITAEQVDAAWDAAKAKFSQAADEARADMANG